MIPTAVPVKKIKKFRVTPRTASVLKNLKALLEDATVTPELQASVESEITRTVGLVDTVALYATWPPNALPEGVLPVLPSVEGESAPVAVGFFVSTIGVRLEEEIARALTQGEGLRSRVLTALGEELAEQSGQLVSRLLSEEAKNDAGELSDRRPLESLESKKALLTALDADRLGISFDDAGHFTPRFSRLGYVLWWPPAKKRR